jgi:hypothetical protein
MVINLQVPEEAGNFFFIVVEQLLASQEILCSVDLVALLILGKLLTPTFL